MSNQYGSVDDLLSGASIMGAESIKQDSPQEFDNEEIPSDDLHIDSPSNSNRDSQKEEMAEEEVKEGDSEDRDSGDLDEYGNNKPKPRVYTEEEHNEILNKTIRDRLARMKQQQPESMPSQQQQQDAKAVGFEYNENSDVPWEQQLENFVERTFQKMSQREQQQRAAEQQREIQQKEVAEAEEFRDKFSTGMSRFSDFLEVVDSQPITDYMTMALRGIKDPSAFIYAASKRAPAELARISKLPDPYAQIVEMGKLEERMRKSPSSTQAPRPIDRPREDSNMKMPSAKSKETIEDLIAQSDAQKRKLLVQKR